MMMVVKASTLSFNLIDKTLVMKKIYITLAVLSLAAIMNTSCDNREEEIKEVPEVTEIGDDAIAFSLGGVSTRAEVSINDVPGEVNIIPLGTDDQNNNFYLEESVIDLDVPVTRGTPVYTENLRTLYGTSIPTYAPAIQVGEFDVTYDDTKELYVSKHFHKEIWPAGDDSHLEFYMHMPSSPTGVSITDRSNGKITFSYTSPKTATDQQDIIFTYRNISKADYDEQGYVDILFHHALTGVKFATKNTESDAVVIKEVKFTGLKTKGTCIVTPTAEDGAYVDKPTNYSSAGAVAWTLGDDTEAIESGKFPTNKDGDGKDISNILVNFSEGGSFTNNGRYPNSFAAAGNANNLNDGDATQTFWLIPQAMTDKVKLEITYTVKGGNETTDGTWTIDFGKALKNVEWKAGQIRTYTIKVDDVNVKISDEVHGAGSAADGYKGSYKDNVVITNTGNTDAFIRAAIVGQWLDSDGNPVFGFTDAVNNLEIVDSWYEDQFMNKNRTHGKFENLAGYDIDSGSNGWHLGTDGYYYYEDYIAPGAPVPVPLFTNYIVDEAPIVTLSGVDTKVYFVLEIATQAVSAKKLDGNYYTWQEAWANANATTAN